MLTPFTIRGELLMPLPIPYGLPHTELERQLRTAGLLPAAATQCRWRMDAERYGYVVSYEVVVQIETEPLAPRAEKG